MKTTTQQQQTTALQYDHDPLPLYSDKIPPECGSLVVVRCDRVDDHGVWGCLPDWGSGNTAYLPLGSIVRHQGRGQRRQQANFLTHASRMTKKKGRNHKPLFFVAEVESVEALSSKGVADQASLNTFDGGLLCDTVRVTVTRRGVTEDEEARVMELSKRNRHCATLIVDQAAQQVGISRKWARRVSLHGPYHHALLKAADSDGGGDDSDEDTDDEDRDDLEANASYAPLAAAWRFLIQDIGRIDDSSSDSNNLVLQFLRPFMSKQDETYQVDKIQQEEFAKALFALCRREFRRLAKPKPCSVTGTIGEFQAVAATVLAANHVVTESACDVTTVRACLASAVATVEPPEGCGDLTITTRGAGTYSFTTMCPEDAMKKTRSYLESVAAKANQGWNAAAISGNNSDKDKTEIPSRDNAADGELEGPRKTLQPSLNIGLIGDVANGKSTLIRAMSGKRTQSHSTEQQKHGMTIRLGFANAAIVRCRNEEECGLCSFAPEEDSTAQANACGYCGGPTDIVKRISFTDCPGHAELMATMLAGASAFDAVIFAAAANTPCPSPQARQHLEALKLSRSLSRKGQLAVAQTKSELIVQQARKNPLGMSADELLSLHSSNAKEALRSTVAAGAPFFPVCAPLNVGLGPLASWLANLPSPRKSSTCSEAHRIFNVLRSFDVNRPGTGYESLVGGVLGGTVSGPGVFRPGDLLEVRPGLVTGNRQGAGGEEEGCQEPFEVCPLFCRCEELMTGKTQLDAAAAGGLVAFRTTLNPSLCADDRLVGAVVGPKGTLPPVWGPTLLLDGLSFVEVDPSISRSRPSDLLKKGVKIRCHSGSATVPGKVLRVSVKRAMLEVQLAAPLCAYKGAGVAIEADVSGRSGFCLVAHASIFGGSCCCEGADAPSEVHESPGPAQDSTDEDYEHRRTRFLDELAEKQMAPEDVVRISVPKPSVTRDGGSHVLVDNFAVIAASLNREPRHLQVYMEREGGLSCARAGNPMGTSLRVRWRSRSGYFPELLSKIIRRYAVSFIVCQQCRGAKTELLKSPTGSGANVELLCRQCNARRFVPKI